MRLFKVFVISALCFSISFAANAQTGDRVKNRAGNRANQRVDQKVDQAVDQAAAKIENLFRKKGKTDETQPEEEPTDVENSEEEATETAPTGGILSGMFGGKFEPYENPIQMNITMEVKSTNNRGKVDQSTMHLTLDTWATGMVMVGEDDKEVRMLFDNQEGYMTIVTEDKDELQGIRMRQPQIDYTQAVIEEDKFTITALGNTRVIDGYNCQEYLIEHEDGNTNSWVTTEIDLDMQAIARAMTAQARQSKKNSYQQFYDMKGFPIESTTISKDGKTTSVVHYSNIKIGSGIDKSVFDTSGVTVTSLGF